ncbi:MAG: hypothetical protein HYV07_21540 [Deltaproteobacteria bacterium]|nr:hypothetical protein [Deltaproteobacteria bacterium]
MTVYTHQDPSSLDLATENYQPLADRTPFFTKIAQAQAALASAEAEIVVAEARRDKYASATKDPEQLWYGISRDKVFALQNLCARIQERITVLGG